MASTPNSSNHPTQQTRSGGRGGPVEPDALPTSQTQPPERGVNLAIIRGRLSRPPQLVDLPSGDRLARLDVTVRRDDAATETMPVQVTEPPASVVGLDTGDEVVVVGFVRRRYYRAGGATASQTEVVADRVLPASHQSRIAKAVGQAVADMETTMELSG